MLGIPVLWGIKDGSVSLIEFLRLLSKVNNINLKERMMKL